MRFRLDAAFVVHHRAMFATYVDAQGELGDFFIPHRQAVYDGVIFFVHLMFFELDIQIAMRVRCQRENHNPAGDFVNAVDDPNSFVSFFQHFDQIRRFRLPAFGKHGKSGGFVYNENMLVLVENLQVFHGLIVTFNLSLATRSS